MSLRSFIAVEIPYLETVESFIEELKATGLRAKFVEPHNMHLTVKFLGDIEEEMVEPVSRAIRKAADSIPPFSMELAGTGVFPHMRRIRVIWIGMKGDEYLRLFESRLARELEEISSSLSEMDQKEFIPHLTIARVKAVGNRSALHSLLERDKDRSFGEAHLKRILLIKSTLTPNGPIYSNLADIRL